MKLLISHNFYQQPGGEDAVARAEKELLSAAGHEARVVEVSALCVQNRQERYPVSFSMVVARFKAAQSGVGTGQ